jgi:hypothetical protein
MQRVLNHGGYLPTTATFILTFLGHWNPGEKTFA